jgi:hypothetical protein
MLAAISSKGRHQLRSRLPPGMCRPWKDDSGTNYSSARSCCAATAAVVRGRELPHEREFTVMTAIWLIMVQWLSSLMGGYITGRLRTK